MHDPESNLRAAEPVASRLTSHGAPAIVIGAVVLATHRYVRHTILTAALASCCLASTAQDAADAAPLPLAEIERGLARNPPMLGDAEGRRGAYIEALDAWVGRADTVYWDGNPETANAEFRDYYLRCIERAVAEAEAATVASGLVVWKLYSSGFLVKTPTATFAFDVAEGPFKSLTRKPEDEPGFEFHWPPELRTRFAGLIDALFVTHRHYDHVSYALVAEVAAAGKTVVVPPDLKAIWRQEDFAGKLTTLAPDADHRLGPVTVRVFQAVQAMQRDEAGEWVVSASDPEHYVYLVRDEAGTSVLHNGDNRGRPFVAWLRNALADGWDVHLWCRILTWPTTVIDDVEAVVKPVVVPGHEYEMGHKPKYSPSLLGGFYRGRVVARAAERRYVVLTWGERLAIERDGEDGEDGD